MKKQPLFLAMLLLGCRAATPSDATAADEPAPVAVDLATVETRSVQDTLAVDGSVVLPEGALSRLAPTVAGKLVEVGVKEGDRVVAGQLLARIDTRALVAQSQSAAAGAASASATADQSALSLKAAQADQEAAVRAAQLALEVATAEGRSSIETAQADLRLLRAGARPQEIAQAQQGVDQARIARDKAKLDADRDARLLKEGLVAGSQADASQAALQTAESALRSSQSSLDLVRSGNRPEEIRASELRLASARELSSKKIDQARATLRQAEAGRLSVSAKAQEVTAARLAAQQKQADARAAAAGIATGEIRSPISGVVVKRFLNPGDTADTTTPVLAVAASGATADFVGNLSPEEAARVTAGMRVLFGKSVGTVASVGEADLTTGLVPIRAHLASASIAGGFATVQIVLSTLRGAAVIPKGAVLSREGKDVVFVAKDGTAHLTEVELGPEQNGLVAVRKGVLAGQKVIVLGGHELSDGAKIKAAEKP
ncbi:efflux RND transporter periplasmic adaptor subunit [soil metagenome]